MSARSLLALPDDLDDLLSNRIEIDTEAFESARRNSLALVNEAEKNVLGTDVVVVEKACLLLSEHNHSASSVCKAFEQGLLASYQIPSDRLSAAAMSITPPPTNPDGASFDESADPPATSRTPIGKPWIR